MGEKWRELYLYSNKISKEELKQFFDQLTKRRHPALRLFDFSYFLSNLPSPLVIKRSDNTIRYYTRETEKVMNMAPLFFPFKVGNEAFFETNKKTNLHIPKIYFFNSENHINLMLKEGINEINFNVIKIFGKYIGYAKGLDRKNLSFYSITLNPFAFLEINSDKHPSIYFEILEPTIKNTSIKSDYPIFEDNDITFGIDNFDPFQHSLFIGEGNTGKTKTLFMVIRALEKRYGGMIRIIALDTSGDLVKELREAKIIDYKENFLQLIPTGGKENTPRMIKTITDMITTAIDKDNKQIERVVFYSVYLLSSINALTMENFGKVITDPPMRMKFISKSKAEEAKKFFRLEFPAIYEKNFNEVIVPIKNFISKWDLYTEKKAKKEESLEELLEKNAIIAVHLDNNFFEDEMIKLIYSSFIAQLKFLAFSQKLKRPLILVIDDLSKINNINIKDVLDETRKYNLYVYSTIQHLNQIEKELADVLLSHSKNIFCFKVDSHDAAMIAPLLNIVLEDYFRKNKTQTEIEEIKKSILTKLKREECVIRYFDGKKYPVVLKLHATNGEMWKEVPPLNTLIKPLTANYSLDIKVNSAELFSKYK
ncbi:MAG: hypothetical protein QXF86_03765 [Candidatus Bilamarchaeaceae archaeon]